MFGLMEENTLDREKRIQIDRKGFIDLSNVTKNPTHAKVENNSSNILLYVLGGRGA